MSGIALLPGFRYGAHPLIEEPTANQAAFHLANLRWVLLSQAPIADPAIGIIAPNSCITLAQFDVPMQAKIASWLQTLASDPTHFLHYLQVPLQDPPLRLGRYAEKLLSYFLQFADCFTLVAQHVSIRRAPMNPVQDIDSSKRDHTTLGELDFLLRDHAGQPLHWEFAVKFFLANGDATPVRLADFIGPDRKNSLQLKLERVLLRQLQQRAPAPFDQVGWRPQAFSRGYLFYPRGKPIAQLAALNPQHAKGSWINASELADLPHSDYLPLPRWRWLPPANALSSDQPLVLKRLPQALQAHWQVDPGRAVLLARIDQSGAEVERIFVRPE